MRPLIGIPPCLDERGRWRKGHETVYLGAAYTRALSEAGAAVVLTPPQREPAALVRRLDGLLLPGGDDFLPETPYPPSARFTPVAAAQLAFDRALLGAALEARLPVLGICYGMQLMALHAGGALHYDVPTDVPGAGPHQLGDDGRHALRVAPGSRLAALLGTDVSVNSRHHQAVADPGRGLRACARTEDGLIEAIEGEDAGFTLGVQWHPESMPPAHARALFSPFVEACRAR